MYSFLVTCTAALIVIGGIFISIGSSSRDKLVGASKIQMLAEFDQFHKFMVLAGCIILCAIPLMMINILTRGNPIADVIAMSCMYLLLLYFLLNIFNRKVILTESTIAVIDALGRGYIISNDDFVGARADKTVIPIRASRFTMSSNRVVVDEQMSNYHLVVVELQRRALSRS